MEIIEISGIQVEVIKKKIKNMNLYVLPPDGRVRVSAPKSISDKKIEMFVNTKLDWINKNQEKIKNRKYEAKKKFETGETLYIWGRPHYLQVEHSNKRSSIILEEDNIILNVNEESTIEQREKIVNKLYRSMLINEIEYYLPKWETKTNLFSNNWQIRNMTSRWGSCNPRTKKICLNLQLAKKPIESLEYVILHEIAHLKVRNHSKDFKDILDEYMPNWRDIKKLLNN